MFRDCSKAEARDDIALTAVLVTMFVALLSVGAWLDSELPPPEGPTAEMTAYTEGLTEGLQRAEAEITSASQAAYALGVERGRSLGCSAAPVAVMTSDSRSAR